MNIAVKTRVALIAGLIIVVAILGLSVGNMLMSEKVSMKNAFHAQAEQLHAVDLCYKMLMFDLPWHFKD